MSNPLLPSYSWCHPVPGSSVASSSTQFGAAPTSPQVSAKGPAKHSDVVATTTTLAQASIPTPTSVGTPSHSEVKSTELTFTVGGRFDVSTDACGDVLSRLKDCLGAPELQPIGPIFSNMVVHFVQASGIADLRSHSPDWSKFVTNHRSYRIDKYQFITKVDSPVVADVKKVVAKLLNQKTARLSIYDRSPCRIALADDVRLEARAPNEGYFIKID